MWKNEVLFPQNLVCMTIKKMANSAAAEDFNGNPGSGA
jgi:hypothetical protein